MSNYMSQDRADLSFASKEVSGGMATPTQKHLTKLRRVIRYLLHARRLVVKYKWQDPQNKFDVFSDSDWAGCVKTRRSTSGGALMHGSHMIHHWASTQSVVALSSAEAAIASVLSLMEVITPA